MDRFHWTPREIETLTDFEYDATLAVVETLAELERSEREKKKGSRRTA